MDIQVSSRAPFPLLFCQCLALLSFLLTEQVAAQLPDYSHIVDKIKPSVVTIATLKQDIAQFKHPEFKGTDKHFDSFLPLSETTASPTLLATSSLSSGSGLVISENGFILTNAHVLEGASRIFIITHDGNEFEAETVGVDEFSDLAILKINSENLVAAKFAADTSNVRAGQVVLGFGSPFALRNSVTSGIVSHVERSLPGMGSNGDYVSYIQTDLNINPGNSGGPIVNANGEVIGINSRIMSTSGGAMGLSFGIPVEVINNVSRQLVQKGYVTRGWVGVSVENIIPSQLKELLLPSPYGALISVILDQSPAQQAGLKVNDVVISIDNHPIRTKSEFTYHVGLLEEGTAAHVSVIRNGRYFATTVLPQQLTLQ